MTEVRTDRTDRTDYPDDLGILAGCWCVVTVGSEAFLLPVGLLAEHPALFARCWLAGQLAELLTQEEGLAAMASCQRSRTGRPD